MLVCNVSLERRRAAIAASVAEIAVADDATTTGNVVFATLVDDPASVRDTVDGYLGEIMREAATAIESVSAGSAVGAAIDEAVTAADAPDATVGIALVARNAMVGSVFVNSGTTSRDAFAGGVMINI